MKQSCPNIRKSKQLGINYSTACNRLRKLVLFSILKKYDLNICYRCNNEILSAKDLTFDHKVDWLNNSTDLFWDIDNVAFSHRKCNIPANSMKIIELAKSAPNDSKYCPQCQQFKKFKEFNSNKSTKSGLADYCRICINIYKREYKKRNKI
jgi:DNA-binding Lrp family transcriptional regulator